MDTGKSSRDSMRIKVSGVAEQGEGSRGGQDEEEEKKRVSYLALCRYARSMDYLLIMLGLLGAVVHGAALPMWALLFGDLMDTFGTMSTASDFMGQVTRLALMFFYLGCGTLVVGYLQTGMWMLIGARQSRRIRVAYLDAVLRQEIAFFDTQATAGKLMTGMNEDTVLLEGAMGEKVGTFVQQGSLFFTGFGVAFAKGWDLTLVMVAIMPLLGAAGAFLFKLTGSITEKTSAAYAEANSIAQQALAAVRTVFSHNAEASVYRAYANKLEAPERMAIKQSYLAGGVVGSFQLVMYCAYALAMWYASMRVREGVYTGGQVLTVFFSALIGGFATAQASPLLTAFGKGRTAAARLFEVIDRRPAMDTSVSGRTLKEVSGKVALCGVDFAYPARPEKKVFDNLTLTVPAGKTVALVGQSGSGKSTIVSLIERFYDPTAGIITLDGVPLPELDLHWLRSQVGLVSQEPTLFATTIYNNIAYGAPGATAAEVEAAARSSNAHGFISALPNGYKTLVGEAGTHLSGGQKQRIAIARALLKNPRVLLLDEATSALDAESEQLVQHALDNLMIGRTTIVVAHRLSTIRKADTICVINEGHIVEQGTHEELLNNPEGSYSQLVRLQQTRGSRMDLKADGSNSSFESMAGKEGDSALIDVPLGPTEEEQAVVVKTSPRVTKVPASPLRNASSKVKPSAAADEETGLTPGKAGVDENEVRVGFGRLLALNRSEWHLALFGCMAAAVLGCVMPAFALALSGMIAVFYIDSSTPEGAAYMMQQSNMWSGIFVGIGTGALLVTFVAQACFGIMGAKLARRVRLMLFEAVLKQEVGWFDREENNSGSLTSHLGTDAQHVRGAVGDAMALMTQNLFTCVAGFTIAFVSGWKMTLVILAVVPVLVVSGLIEVQLQQRMHSSPEASHASAAADQVAAEAFRHARVVHAFNLHTDIRNLWEGFSSADFRAKSISAHVSGAAFGFSQFAMFSVYGLAFWFGGTLVNSGEMTMEEMLKVFFAVVMAAMGASQAQMGFPDSAKAGAALKRIFAVVDRTPAIDPNAGVPAPLTMEGAVDFSNVQFTYPNRPGVIVFEKLTLKVPVGKMVALVGESGSGKSTVIGLIERFYDVDGGVVRVDSCDIKSLPLRWVRSNVGLVSQEPTLFALSVKDNIKLGYPTATDEEVEAAARTANAHGFISALPEGYDTLIGEKGVQLSGGQKQRVAIARAVLKNPRVLLLDEATSALDAESERLVQDALEKLMAGRTTLVVAHRLSTIRQADIIAVMKKGRIVEQGTHDDLLSINGGAYASLIKLQQAAGH